MTRVFVTQHLLRLVRTLELKLKKPSPDSSSAAGPAGRQRGAGEVSREAERRSSSPPSPSSAPLTAVRTLSGRRAPPLHDSSQLSSAEQRDAAPVDGLAASQKNRLDWWLLRTHDLRPVMAPELSLISLLGIIVGISRVAGKTFIKILKRCLLLSSCSSWKPCISTVVVYGWQVKKD